MTESSGNVPIFLESIRAATAEAFSKAFSSAWNVEIAGTPDAPVADASRITFGLSASGNLRGDAAVLTSSASVLLLAQRLRGEPEVAQELNAELKKTVEELLRQVAGITANGLKTQFGEVKLEVNAMEAPSQPSATAILVAADASGSGVSLGLYVSPELVASLNKAVVQNEGTHLEAGSANPALDGEEGLGRLSGVDLRLSLRFGQRSLTLREIIDLTSGSIIDLEQKVDDAAELFLGDKLLARGEVVVVDGNYGIRVTEVPGIA